MATARYQPNTKYPVSLTKGIIRIYIHLKSKGFFVMKKSDMFWQTYLNLERELLELSRYIYITDHKLVYEKIDGVKRIKTENCPSQLETFSPYIADLLTRTCIEIEAISKELYFELGGTKIRGDKDIFFDEDCLKLIETKCRTSTKVVIVSCTSFNLNEEQNKVLKPLKNAHERQGTIWERAYQAVKHDRYTSISKGTIKSFIHALAALYLLNIYYKNDRLYTKYLEMSHLDMSFGSKVFSLRLPDQQYVVDVINGKEISENLLSKDSPYVLKYTDNSYTQVLDANKKLRENRQKYFSAQPELKEPAFIEQLNQAKKVEEKDPARRVLLAWELGTYRINKRIPKELPFEERKRLFVNSPEFHGRIRLLNHPKKESELTEENLQSEIDTAGRLAGMEIDYQLGQYRDAKAFNEGFCELVIDRGDVRYGK